MKTDKVARDKGFANLLFDTIDEQEKNVAYQEFKQGMDFYSLSPEAQMLHICASL